MATRTYPRKCRTCGEIFATVFVNKARYCSYKCKEASRKTRAIKGHANYSVKKGGWKPNGKKKVGFDLEYDNMKVWRLLENRSAFVNLALKHAVGIMTLDLLNKDHPEVFPIMGGDPEPVAQEFNHKHPAVVNIRNKKVPDKNLWPTNSPKTPELW